MKKTENKSFFTLIMFLNAYLYVFRYFTTTAHYVK